MKRFRLFNSRTYITITIMELKENKWGNEYWEHIDNTNLIYRRTNSLEVVTLQERKNENNHIYFVPVSSNDDVDTTTD